MGYRAPEEKLYAVRRKLMSVLKTRKTLMRDERKVTDHNKLNEQILDSIFSCSVGLLSTHVIFYFLLATIVPAFESAFATVHVHGKFKALLTKQNCDTDIKV